MFLLFNLEFLLEFGQIVNSIFPESYRVIKIYLSFDLQNKNKKKTSNVC